MNKYADGWDWTSIETAPMDGSVVDLWCVNRGSGSSLRAADVYWDTDLRAWCDWRNEALAVKYMPTHWRRPSEFYLRARSASAPFDTTMRALLQKVEGHFIGGKPLDSA